MYKLLKNLYVPEWFKAFNPRGFVSKLIMFIRVLSPALSKVTDKTLNYKARLIRSGYSPLVIPDNSIVYIKDLQVAGSKAVADTYHYRVTGIKEDYHIMGCGLTPYMAVKGFDYIIQDDCYWFKENPAKYCYTYVEDQPVHYTVGFCGSYTKAHQAYDSICSKFTTHDSLSAYDATIRSGFMGLSNSIPLLLQGISTTAGVHGTVDQRWTEKGVTFAIMSTGAFIKSYKDNVVNASTLSTPKEPSTVFVIKNKDKWLPVSMGINYLDSYPGLLDTYKTLKVYGDDLFLGKDLYKIIKDLGCNFIELDYINRSTQDICNSSYKAQNCSIVVLPGVRESVIMSNDVSKLHTEADLKASAIINIKGSITVNYL